MSLLIFEDPRKISDFSEDYINFDFYMLDINFNNYLDYEQEKLIDRAKRKLDLIRDKVTFLTLRYYEVVNKSFIDMFRNLTELRLYEVTLEVANDVLKTLKDNKISIKKLSISLEEDQTDEDIGDKQVKKFSMPSLVYLNLGRFSSSKFMEMFDFSNIRTLKLKECSLYDLPISNTIEKLEISSCIKCTIYTFYMIALFKNLKSLTLRYYSAFPISEFLMFFYTLKSLKKIAFSICMGVDTLVACLLKDGIQEINFSDCSLICNSDDKSIKAISCALCGTTAKKLHLNRCTLNSTMINVLRDNSSSIEYISLREISVNDRDAIKSLETLIRYSEFRVCDLRFINENYITSPITYSNIDNIIIDCRPDIIQKFSGLIEIGKAIPMKKDAEAIFTRSFPNPKSNKKGITLDPIIKLLKYDRLFPVCYINTPDNMEANLREMVVIRDLSQYRTLDRLKDFNSMQIAALTVAEGMFMHVKLPPDRHIIIPPKPDHNIEIKSDYDFTIFIRINNKGRIEETKIPCHKSVLSSKSEMFRKMFSVQMKENLLNEMVTDNIYYKDFIEYLYTNKLSLNKDNIIPLVELARMHFIKDLEYKIIAYIYKHKDQIDIEDETLEKYNLIF
jgi:hypothetical protein